MEHCYWNVFNTKANERLKKPPVWRNDYSCLISFLWNQSKVSVAVFLGSMLKRHLHHPGRIPLSTFFPIYPSFIYMKFADAVQTSLLVTDAISKFCNNKVAKVWWALFASTHLENFLCPALVVRHFITGHHLGRNQLILMCTDKLQDHFLITDRFQLLSWFHASLRLQRCHSIILHMTSFLNLFVWFSWASCP